MKNKGLWLTGGYRNFHASPIGLQCSFEYCRKQCGGYYREKRKRIGLARTVLQDMFFLLLDEPISNLDSLNEAIVLSLCARGEPKKL